MLFFIFNATAENVEKDEKFPWKNLMSGRQNSLAM